jgi:hypothetical protein
MSARWYPAEEKPGYLFRACFTMNGSGKRTPAYYDGDKWVTYNETTKRETEVTDVTQWAYIVLPQSGT